MDLLQLIAAEVAALALLISSLAVIEKFAKNKVSGFFLGPIRAILNTIEEKVDNLDSKIDKHERDSLRTAIVDFANDLKNGEHKSEVQYRNICDTIDKYTVELKGNTYAEQEAAYIKTKMNER